MKIKVDPQAKRFFLAGEEWIPVVGHEIKVDEYRFCAIPHKNGINISEVTSGSKVYQIPYSIEVMLATATKEMALLFLEDEGRKLEKMIKKQKDISYRIKHNREVAFQYLGEMPDIEYVDIEWGFVDEARYLN